MLDTHYDYSEEYGIHVAHITFDAENLGNGTVGIHRRIDAEDWFPGYYYVSGVEIGNGTATVEVYAFTI